MLHQKTYKRLLDWKQTRGGQTVMLLEGAPGTGKTTLARAFGRTYRTCLYIDCAQAGKDIRTLNTTKHCPCKPEARPDVSFAAGCSLLAC